MNRTKVIKNILSANFYFQDFDGRPFKERFIYMKKAKNWQKLKKITISRGYGGPPDFQENFTKIWQKSIKNLLKKFRGNLPNFSPFFSSFSSPDAGKFVKFWLGKTCKNMQKWEKFWKFWVKIIEKCLKIRGKWWKLVKILQK